MPESPLRVTIVVDSQLFGGAERYVATSLQELRSVVRPTLLVSAPAPDRLVAAADAAEVPVRSFRVPAGKFDLMALRRLSQDLAATEPDVVHVNMATVTNNRHALLVTALRGAPAVGFVHLWSPVTSQVQRRLLSVGLRRVRHMVAASAPIAERLVDELRFPRDRVSVMRHGLPDPGPPPDRAGRPGPLHVVSLGRLVPEKGYDVLLDAIRRLADRGNLLRVSVAGDGPERDRLQEMSAGLPVRWLGETSDPDRLLREADVFCLPSRNEAIGFALLEAMAAGLPCVASAIGQIPGLAPQIRLVPPEDAGALADALGDLMADPDARRRLGDAARQRVLREHSVAAMVDGMLDAYRNAAARAPVSGRGR